MKEGNIMNNNYQAICDQFKFNSNKVTSQIKDFLIDQIEHPLVVAHAINGQPIRDTCVHYTIGFTLDKKDRFQLTISDCYFTGALLSNNSVEIRDNVSAMADEVIGKYQEVLTLLLARLNLALYKVDFDTIGGFIETDHHLVPMQPNELITYVIDHWEQYVFYSKKDLLIDIAKSDIYYEQIMQKFLTSSLDFSDTAGAIINLIKQSTMFRYLPDKLVDLTQKVLNRLDLDHAHLTRFNHYALLDILVANPKLTVNFKFNADDLRSFASHRILASLNANTRKIKFKICSATKDKIPNLAAVESMPNHPQIEYD